MINKQMVYYCRFGVSLFNARRRQIWRIQRNSAEIKFMGYINLAFWIG